MSEWRFDLKGELPVGIVEILVARPWPYRDEPEKWLAKLSEPKQYIPCGTDTISYAREWEIYDDYGRPTGVRSGGCNIVIRSNSFVYAWRPRPKTNYPAPPEELRHITDDLMEHTDEVPKWLKDQLEKRLQRPS